MYTEFSWGNLMERDYLEELSIGSRIITIKPVFKKQEEDVDLIDVAQDRDRHWALVNTGMSSRLPKNAGNMTSDELVASQE
jgi:hypothetical protein